MEKKKSAASYAMLIGAMLIFGTIGIFRRSIPLSSALLAGTRGLLGALSLFTFGKITGRGSFRKIKTKSLLLLALSGAMMGANWIFLFEAYNHTTVALATLCYYMQPTIVTLLSPLVLREKITPRKLLCVFVSLAGMGLVSGLLPGGICGALDGVGILLGLTAAFLYAGVILINKKADTEDAYAGTVLQLFAASAVLLPYLLLTEDFGGISFSPCSLLLLLTVGLVHTGLAYGLYFSGIRSLPAQSVAVLSYIDPVAALLLSALFLDETPTVYGTVGAVLIIGSALASELGSRPRNKES